MLEIKLHEVIDVESNAWMYEWLGMNRPFTLETLQGYLNDNPDEKDIRLNIHCDGGVVSEGFAMYDYLRSSGRNIYANVEGRCHSMAIVMLLSAPKDQRSAMPNSEFLIHEISGGVQGNTSAVEKYAEEMKAEQSRMLDIYADRTGRDKADLERIMKEEKMRDAQFMLDWGFIGSINQYNTNLKDMKLLEGLKNLISQAEKEEMQDGAQAVPTNEIETLNARIEELEGEKTNVMAEMDNIKSERDTMMNERDNAIAERDAKVEEMNNLTAERDELQNKLNEANETINAKDKEIEELKAQVGSHYEVGNRLNGQGAQERIDKTSEERKNEVREALEAQKKGKK